MLTGHREERAKRLLVVEAVLVLRRQQVAAARVGDGGAVQRHVQVGADEDPLAGDAFGQPVGDPARAADIDWSLIPPQLGGLSSSAHGDLTGLNDLTTSKALEVIPFVTARSDFSRKFTVDPRRQANLSGGGDMRLQISPGGYLEATLLTDFAQVEADEVQVARDRFPLFFPERRPFFLNGLDVVNFGREREAQLFFSRRIGLDAGQPVPIASGLKAYGR